jgi:hypothetical protein
MRTYAVEKNIGKYQVIAREEKKTRGKTHNNNNKNNNRRLMGSHFPFYRYVCIGIKHTYQWLL